MRIYERPLWEDTDRLSMHPLAREFAAENLHMLDLPYRLSSWAFDDLEK